MKKKTEVVVEEKEKVKDTISLRRALYVIIVLVLLLVAIVVLPKYFLQKDHTTSFEYNGYEFQKQMVENTHIEGYFVSFYDQRGYLNNIPFYYPPKELEPLVVDPAIKSALFNFNSDGTIYLSVEPDSNASYVLAATEIAKILGQKMLGFNVKSALVFPIDGKFDFDIVEIPLNGTNETKTYNRTLRTSQGLLVRNCEDAHDDSFVIQIKEMPRNYVAYANNCITIAATNPDQAMMLTDALLYRLLGIMEN